MLKSVNIHSMYAEAANAATVLRCPKWPTLSQGRSADGKALAGRHVR